MSWHLGRRTASRSACNRPSTYLRHANIAFTRNSQRRMCRRMYSGCRVLGRRRRASSGPRYVNRVRAIWRRDLPFNVRRYRPQTPSCIETVKTSIGDDKRVTNDPMEAHYTSALTCGGERGLNKPRDPPLSNAVRSATVRGSPPETDRRHRRDAGGTTTCPSPSFIWARSPADRHFVRHHQHQTESCRMAMVADFLPRKRCATFCWKELECGHVQH